MAKTRSVRHFKQLATDSREIVWRRTMLYEGVRTVPGQKVPASVSGARLKRFWDLGWIGHLEASYKPHPTAQDRRREKEKAQAESAAKADETAAAQGSGTVILDLPIIGEDDGGATPAAESPSSPPAGGGGAVSFKTGDGKVVEAFAQGFGHVGDPTENADPGDEQPDGEG